MYESFYGLKEKPFSLLPDHRFLYLNRRYQLALSLLEFGVLNNNGMILLTGDPGTGKTTLLQKILSTVARSVIVGKLAFTQDKELSLLPWVLKAFGIQTTSPHSVDQFQAFTDFFHKKIQEQFGLLLVVDEAQNLNIEKLEELRLLFNLNDREGSVLQILLAGHTQFRGQLQDPQLHAFVQRIGTDFSLEPFSQDDTKAYILHRIQAVGGVSTLFSDEACALIYRYTKGNPRLINQLCETSLLYGFSDQKDSITEQLVAEAGKDRLQGGLLPLAKIDEISSPLKPKSDPEPLNIAREPIKSIPVSSTEPESASPLSVSSRQWAEAMKLKEQGWYLEAIQSFKTVATDVAYHRNGWFQVGQCYLAMGRHSSAIEAFKAALGDSPKQPQESAAIYYAIGQVLKSLGRDTEAKQYADLTWLTDPSFSPGSTPKFHSSPLSNNVASHLPKRSWFARIFHPW